MLWKCSVCRKWRKFNRHHVDCPDQGGDLILEMSRVTSWAGALISTKSTKTWHTRKVRTQSAQEDRKYWSEICWLEIPRLLVNLWIQRIVFVSQSVTDSLLICSASVSSQYQHLLTRYWLTPMIQFLKSGKCQPYLNKMQFWSWIVDMITKVYVTTVLLLFLRFICSYFGELIQCIFTILGIRLN